MNNRVVQLRLGLCLLGFLFVLGGGCLVQQQPSSAESSLFLAYPPDQHKTTSDKIFFIGTAPSTGQVLLNGQAIPRSAGGHFAPSLPLALGDNTFTLTYQNQSLQRHIQRQSTQPQLDAASGFVLSSLQPQTNLVRQPGEELCFQAITSPQATVQVTLADQVIPLQPQSPGAELPPNSALLTQQNQPQRSQTALVQYAGCAKALATGDLGAPTYQVQLANQTRQQAAPGNIKVLEPSQFQVAEVTAAAGVARTGPSTDYSRLTPLPQGTRAVISGEEGDWFRLAYGAWIRKSDVKVSTAAVPVRSQIRSASSRIVGDWTEVIFPLETPVPLAVQQGDRTFVLTLYDTTAQTDTIKLNDDPVIKRLDWTQSAPSQVTYTFQLKSAQQWGYKLRYEGTSLILSLKHPPQITPQSLNGVKILLDPGHGSANDYGTRGPTGYPEKDATLKLAKLVQPELEKLGAKVILSRLGDDDVLPGARADQIDREEPAIAISLHYNALPDSGDAWNTKGVGSFWYNAQSHDLALFLQQRLVKDLNRSSYGLFWNNLALTRPTVAPAILLEFGFMINPEEFEWIVNPEQQQRLAVVLAQGIRDWFVRAVQV